MASLVYHTRVEVPNKVCWARKAEFDAEAEIWGKRHLSAYSDAGKTDMNFAVEGADAKHVVAAHNFLARMATGKSTLSERAGGVLAREPASTEMCPVCPCEAEDAVTMSCKHTYCAECLENLTSARAPMCDGEFDVKCLGDDNACATIFSWDELSFSLSSPAFERMLESSFHDYVRRRPEDYRPCPTPECDFIYRCAEEKPLPYTYGNCLDNVCRSCYGRHVRETCAEFQDEATGDHEGLSRLIKELGIRNCPRCETLLEKTEGCNRVHCAGCKWHLCWVCDSAFPTDGECYEHLLNSPCGLGADPNVVFNPADWVGEED
jgi:hypothetical protein